MSPATLETPEQEALLETNDATPAEPLSVHGNGASAEGGELERHFAGLRDALGEYDVNYAESYLEHIVQSVRRDLDEQAPDRADKHDYEEELLAKLDRAKHLAGAVVDAASQGEDTSLDAVTSLGMTLETMLGPLPELCEHLISELPKAEFTLRAAREDSSNGHNGHHPTHETTGPDASDEAAKDGGPDPECLSDGPTNGDGAKATAAATPAAAESATPDGTTNDDSVFESAYMALPQIRGIIEQCSKRLRACSAIFDAEMPDSSDLLPFDQANGIDAIVRGVRQRLLDECVEPIARICRTRDRWLDKEGVERIQVNRELTRAQYGAITGIVRELAKLPGEELRHIYENIDTLVQRSDNGDCGKEG